MTIAFGHDWPDLDCLAALIVVKKLFPGCRLVKAGRLQPAARNLCVMYRGEFDFLEAKDLAGERIERAVIVDASSRSRIRACLSALDLSGAEIIVFDHHDFERCDIPGAKMFGARVGAAASIAVNEAARRAVPLTGEEATIALTGIFADTGRLLHSDVSRDDFAAAMYLLGQGAQITLVKSFLDSIGDEEQLALTNRLLSCCTPRVIRGHATLLAYCEVDGDAEGLSAAVDRVMELEHPDALFALFYRRRQKSVQIIARSQAGALDVRALLAPYGGGGRKAAAAAKAAACDGEEFFRAFAAHLERAAPPAVCARDIMTRRVDTIRESATLLEASLFLEKIDRSGVPVVNDAGEPTGFIGLRDIMKGRKARQMHGMVKGYMARNLVTADGSVTLRGIERIFYRNHIGHLPIVEDGRLAGIVTRRDYLKAQAALRAPAGALLHESV